MDPPYRPQPIDVQTDHVDGLSRPEEYPESCSPVLGIEPRPQAQPSNISPLSHDTAPDFRPSNVSSSQSNSYYTASSSPSYSATMKTASTLSSNMSFPYSVTSINSRKSRKNVLYPRRIHSMPPPEPVPVPEPVSVVMPAPVPSENLSMSLGARIWLLCTSLLPHTETRLVPAGKVLLKSLGHGKISEPVPVRIDEETHCCSTLFITLTHEVHLNRVVSATELEGPCKLLHTTFKDILSKSGTFSSPMTPGPRGHRDDVSTLQRSSNVFYALLVVLNTFETTLNTIKLSRAPTKDGSRGDYYRLALLELSTPTGLTIEKYRTKLNHKLAHEYPPSPIVIPMIPPRKGAPQAISTIEEGTEAEGEGSSSNGQSSLPRRIFRRLIPSSVGRKDL